MDLQTLNTFNGITKYILFPSCYDQADILTSGGGDGTVYVWTLPSGSILHVLSGHTDAVTCGAFNHTGNV